MAASEIELAKARVDAARQALDSDVATLSDRLPGLGVIGAAGAASGTGAALLGVAVKQLQKRSAQRSKEKGLTREAEIQAKAIAAAMAAVGLTGGQSMNAPSPSAGPTSTATPSPARAARRVEEAVVTHDDEDGGGPPWGILLLLAGLVAAVVALVGRVQDDEDLWTTPGLDDGGRATEPPGVVTP